MSIERADTRGQGADARPTADGAGAHPAPGTVVHVELGGVALSSPFRGEARRMGIVVEAGAPEQAWQFLDASDGTVLATVDPYDLPPAVDFIRGLRRKGSSAGVVAVAATRGLRRTTSFPLRRAGVDEFVALSADADEFAASLREAVRLTRVRSGQPYRPLLPSWSQPRAEDGDYRPMSVGELAGALRERLEAVQVEPFALALLRLRGPRDAAWHVLKRWVRLEEGDLLASVDDDAVAVALEGVEREMAGAVLDRIVRSQPGLGAEVLMTLRVPPDDGALDSLLESWRDAVAPQRSPRKGRSI